MKKSAYLAVIALALVIVLPSAEKAAQKSQSADVLLGAALHQEEVEGNLEAAIETYKKILADYPDNRPVAARALLQMGHCYEKLGKDEAGKAYERLVRDYADQNEAAAQARTRLAALRRPPVVSKEAALATRKIWTLPDMGNVEGAPSPDGRYISFTDWETGDLAIRDLEAGTNRRLTDKGSWEKSEEFAQYSRWSPDGKRIAYDWYDGKCCVDLRVIEIAGGKPRVLVDYENDEWMQTYDWSPDGKQILVFLEKKDATGQIVLVSATDGATRVIKTFERRGRFPNIMRFSCDGRYIAYDQPQEENAAERDIFLISADGAQEIALVEHPAHDSLLGWPPDGKGILFASDRTGSLDVWFLPVAGGKVQGPPELVRRGIEQIVPLGFTQNGSFYYAQGGSMLDAYVARMDRQSGKILAPPEKAVKRFEGANSWPEYSPDGKYLAYVSTRSRTFQAAMSPNIVCIRSLETAKEQEFTTKFKRLAGPRWSPDGQFLYLAAWDDQGMGIYRVDTHTGTMIPVVRDDGSQRIYSHNVSFDGKTLIYVRCYQVAPKRLYRVLSRDLATGEEKELYTGSAEDGRLDVALSRDGEQLAVINQDKKKALRLIPTKGGKPRDLLKYEDARDSFSCLEWSADGKYIVFPRLQPAKDDPRCSLWRISADGGEPQELGLTMAAFWNMSVHPDGVHLAFSSLGPTMTSPSVWVMENFLPPALAAPEPVTMIARRLENPPADTPSGAISPDGRHFSYWDWRTGDLAVRDLQTGQDRRLTDEGTEGKEGSAVNQMAGGSTWSSDGKQIAYAWYFFESGAVHSELRVVGLDGFKPRVLSHDDGIREIGSLAWSPDGKYIAASFYPQNGSLRIELISTADGITRTLTDLKRDATKRFSPDSRYIAYDRLSDEMSPERDIFLMSIDTGQETPLVQHPADDYLLDWSRDGKWLVFASDRTGALGLWVVGMSGAKTQGEPQLVKPGIDLIQPIGLTPKGALYYGVVRATEDVFVADLDPTTGKVAGPPRRAIEQFEGGNFTPSYSPDGKYLAYMSRRGNSPYPTNVGNTLCIRSLDTGQERVFYREIWRLGLRFIGGPRWSPDSRFISFGGSEGVEFTDAYRIDLQTGEITRILRCGPDEQITGAAYGPDGKHFFGRGNGKKGFSQIVVRDLESGKEQERKRLAGERRVDIALSPDGRWLSFSNGGSEATRSLRIMPASGGDVREIWSFGETKQGTPTISHTWTPDGRYILFGAPDQSDLPSYDLWRVPVEGGKPEKMGLQRRWGIWHITVRPDGRQIMFAGRGGASTDSELWVLENFLPPAQSSK